MSTLEHLLAQPFIIYILLLYSVKMLINCSSLKNLDLMVAGEVRRELCPLTCLTFTFVLISGIETSKALKDPRRARYYREYRAKASAEQKAIWAERSRLRYQRLKNEKKAKEKKEKKRRQNQAYYRKKKLAGHTLLDRKSVV